MIDFIICDDVKKYRILIKNVIDKYMMKNQIDYRTHIYKDYDEDFLKIVSTRLPMKVYILDIVAPTSSGLDMARIIRHKETDSVVIFLTGHDELGQKVLEGGFSFLAYINKFDNCEGKLVRALDDSIRNLKIRKTIKFKDCGINYSIPLEDILFITRDSVDRKCIIKTDYSEFRINKSLSEISDMLPDYFIRTHRACLINQKRVVKYNKGKRIVIFDDGSSCDLISSRFDKELI